MGGNPKGTSRGGGEPTSAESVALGSALCEKDSHEDGEQAVEALAARFGTRDPRGGEELSGKEWQRMQGLASRLEKKGKGND